MLDRKVKNLLDSINARTGKSLRELALADVRGNFSRMQASVPVDLSGVVVMKKTIETDGQSIRLYIVRPEGIRGDLPAFLYFHGGGWVTGDFPTHERLVRDLVIGSGVAAIFVDYALAPEAPYPAAIHQGYAAARWVSMNGSDIGIDGSRLAVAGNSAGGNIAIVVALMAREKGGPSLRTQVLFCPVIHANFTTRSYEQFAKGYFLSRDAMQWMWEQYIPIPAMREEIYASPLLASQEQLQGLPPALVLLAENDILHDEGAAYAARLDEAGVKVTAVCYLGMIHDWILLNVLAETSGSRSAIAQAAAMLRSALVV